MSCACACCCEQGRQRERFKKQGGKIYADAPMSTRLQSTEGRVTPLHGADSLPLFYVLF